MTRPTARHVYVAVLVLLGIPVADARAQQVCRDDETVEQCWARHVGLGVSAKAEEERGEKETAVEVRGEALFAEATQLLGKATGIAPLQTPALNTAIDDFLSKYAGTVTRLGENDEDIGFGFEATFPFFSGSSFTPLEIGGDLRLRLLAAKPRVLPSLLDALADSVREEIGLALRQPLDDADDVTIEIGWNRESERFGRSFARRARMLDSLLTGIIDDAAASVPRPDQRLNRFIQIYQDSLERFVVPENHAACVEAIHDGSFDRVAMSCFVPDFRSHFEDELLRNAITQRNFETAIRAGLDSSGFHHIAELINNQPQFSVSAYTKLRAAAVGPRSYGVRFRAEKGYANLNALRGSCPDKRITPACMATFVRNAGVRSALESGDRLWVAFELDYTEPLHYTNTKTRLPVQFDAERTWSARLTGGYGRYLGVDPTGAEQSRLDASLELDLITGDPDRHDRVVGMLTWTHKLNDSVVIPLGVTIANRAKYARGSGEEFLFNVGLRFDLQPDVQLPGGS